MSRVRAIGSRGSDERARGRLRFHLAVQKSRFAVYLVGLALALLMRWTGAFTFETGEALVLFAAASLSAVAFYALYRKRVDERTGIPLEPFWMACDVVIIGWGIYISGGLESEWYIWYLANAGAAAFVGGIPAAVAVIAANSLSYIGVLALLGDVQGFDHGLGVAVVRLVFLFGAAIFFLRGVAKLKERQAVIRELRREDQRRLEELSRLTDELDRANEKLRELAVTDPLTGLHNRRYFTEQIDLDWAAVRRNYVGKKKGERRHEENVDLGVALADIDRFKRINDQYGHAVGDRILRSLGEILTGTVRANDSVIRWGGEEFLVLMRRVDRDYLAEVVDRLRARIEEHEFHDGEGRTIELTCSVGWSCYPAGDEWIDLLGWQEVVQLADEGLYLAKQNGRDLAVGVVPGERAPAPEEVERMLDDLEWAVERGFLELVCEQPLDLEAGRAAEGVRG